MSSNQKITIRSFGHKALVALRKKLNIRPKFTMPEVVHKSGLQVVYFDGVSPAFAGFLDPHDYPRYIAVNRNVPPEDQVFAVARELGYCAQDRRQNSLALDRPWKWRLFDDAPEEIQQKISELDAECRAQLFMMAFATGDQFRAFVKKYPKKYFWMSFHPNIVGFHLFVLRIRTWIFKIFYFLALS